MQKHIYKGIILFTIFIAALLFMSKYMKEEDITLEKTVKMDEATFPLMEVTVEGTTVNRLHGYSSNIDATVIREAVTPIHQDKELALSFVENDTTIKKIKYEVRALKDNTLLDTGTISALDTTKTGKSVKIKLEAALDTSTEYAMKITAISDESRKINFYTRIKYYETDDNFSKKMSFVKLFHDKSMNKEQAKELSLYLETDTSDEGTDYSTVTIHSSLDRVSWGTLKPKVLTEMVPTIKEWNVETASVQLEYFVSIKNDSGTEHYRVKEFYRIRYTASRVYLLDFERTMESLFDVDLTSLSKSEFKLGLIPDSDLQIVSSSENSKVSFVHGGELWYYSLPENKIVQVFSFRSKDGDDIRDSYDQHNIRILNMDDGGNMDFVVYGYMNRGDYEGKVALVLYHYSADTNRIKELVYIPLETSYQKLKEEISDFSYVSEKGVFYFTISDSVYAYNISAKNLKRLVSGVDKNTFVVIKEGHSIAWIKKEDKQALFIMNLETEDVTKINAKDGEILRIFGSIEADVVYGYVKESDIMQTKEGSVYIPAYKVEITDVEGTVIKKYQQKNAYIIDSQMNGNIIKLYRVKKDGNAYVPISEDSILTQGDTSSPNIQVVTRVTELMQTEKYLSLPDGFVMEKKPEVLVTLNAILNEDTTLHIPEGEEMKEKYYVYAKGMVIDAFSDVTKAIAVADEEMGVVVNQDNRLIFERSGKYNRKTIGQLKETYARDGIDSIGACLYMVLQHNQITADAKKLSGNKTSIFETLQKSMSSPLYLSGCTLDEVLYQVSNGSLVIAMKDDNSAVVINGYDEASVTYFDPSVGKVKISLVKAKTMFEDAGNVFISYLN